MPSFDIFSKVDLQEVDNAVNQALKEIGTRFDFRGSTCQIEFDKKELIKLVADDEFKMRALWDVLLGKLIKRGIDPKALDQGKTESAFGGAAKCDIKLKQGIPTDTAKKMTKHIKDSDLKVHAQIQDEQVRVTGKKRDDLQAAITSVRGKDFGLPLQFGNFRD